jgi:hypothetical protein
MIADKACAERGCACYDSRVDKDGVQMVPQREWVGLTDEEIWEMPIPARITGTLFYVRRIEAKLKQKNGYAEEKNT